MSAPTAESLRDSLRPLTEDPRRAAVRDVLFYYRDYGLEGEVELGGRTYRVMLNDALTTGDFRSPVSA